MAGYSGGSFFLFPDPGVDVPYNFAAGGYGFATFGGGIPAFLSGTGAVTATYQWQADPGDGGEAPPQCVIVEKHCSVVWEADAFLPDMSASG